MMQDYEFNENQEMFLERLWCLREKGKNTQDRFLGTQDQQNRKDLLVQFQETGYLKIDGAHVDFMPKGEEYARGIIRRRRLTEVLLYNVLRLEMNTVETNACKIEHIVNQEVTDSICAFLDTRCVALTEALSRGETAAGRAMKILNRWSSRLIKYRWGRKHGLLLLHQMKAGSCAACQV